MAKKKAEPRITISVRLLPSVHDRLKEYADENGLLMSSVISMACTQFLKSQDMTNAMNEYVKDNMDVVTEIAKKFYGIEEDTED